MTTIPDSEAVDYSERVCPWFLSLSFIVLLIPGIEFPHDDNQADGSRRCDLVLQLSKNCGLPVSRKHRCLTFHKPSCTDSLNKRKTTWNESSPHRPMLFLMVIRYVPYIIMNYWYLPSLWFHNYESPPFPFDLLITINIVLFLYQSTFSTDRPCPNSPSMQYEDRWIRAALQNALRPLIFGVDIFIQSKFNLSYL